MGPAIDIGSVTPYFIATATVAVAAGGDGEALTPSELTIPKPPKKKKSQIVTYQEIFFAFFRFERVTYRENSEGNWKLDANSEAELGIRKNFMRERRGKLEEIENFKSLESNRKLSMEIFFFFFLKKSESEI